jgi:PilZ domain-containing protein
VQMNHGLGGRKEKRLPIAIVVRLSRMQQSPAKEETTYTDNISPHGARMFSISRWQHGERAQVTTVKEGSSILGEVIYCQRLDSGRFCIGMKFQQSGHHAIDGGTFPQK